MIIELELDPDGLTTAQRLSDERHDGDLSALVETLPAPELERRDSPN
jgi:hypothetical protein